MMTPWRALLLAVALVAVACSQAALPGTGGLEGVGTVAVVRVTGWDGGVDAGAQVDAQYGQIAFITSSGSDDLKGLDLILTDPSQIRNYVPAPNPLQPLSIPVVNQPQEIVPAVRYGRITTQQLGTFPLGFMDGQVRTGMLLFVRGAASPNISVVGAANVPESLRQLTNGLLIQSAGQVTAISARLTTSEQNVVLYYATFDGQDATIWERVLQHPQSSLPGFTGPFPTSLTPVLDCSVPIPPSALPSTTLYLCPQRPVRTYQNASVSALQVLPTLPTDPPLPVLGGLEGGRLAVGLRDLVPPLSNASLSNSGEVRIIDPALPADLDANGTSSDPYFRLARYYAPFDNPQPPLIPGAPPQPPVRSLLTHPRAYNLVADGGTFLDPVTNFPAVLAFEGARLFGVVDESSCYGSIDCTGILAVDAAPVLVDGGANSNYGLLAFDGSDCLLNGVAGLYCVHEVGTTNRMLAIRSATGVIQGVAIEAAVVFPAPTALNLDVIPLLGVVTMSSASLDRTQAQIFFFDALGLRLLNEASPPGINTGITLVIPGIEEAAVDGGDLGLTSFVDVNVGVGLYPASETISITNEGSIPGLTQVQGLPSDGGFLSDGGLADILVWPVPPAGALAASAVLEVNDYLFPLNLSGTPCVLGVQGGITPLLLVVGVDDAGANIFTQPLTVGDGGPLELLEQCPGTTGYTVLTGPNSALPFLVTGSSLGVLGRMASPVQPPPGSPLVPGPVFQIPNSITDAIGLKFPRFYNPTVPPGEVIEGDVLFPPGGPDAGIPVLPLTMQFVSPVDTTFSGNIGAFYTFVLSSGFLAASLPIDEVGLGFGGLFLPGGVAQSRVIDVNGEAVLDIVAYPSSNTVIDFDPSVLQLDVPNSGPINVHF
jgi:hypothetical protein